ncbi:MAG TPA: hypothetical protein VNM40_04500 [Candidatus Paceibacterota bacterium]|nr:hypothetical protein [Candidatus Paceibacterota bacterium]
MWSIAERARLVLAPALFGAVVFAPWWIPFIIGFALAARFRAWEVVAAGLLYDLLWLENLSLQSFWTLPLGTIFSLVAVIGLEPLRRRLLVGPAIL